MYPFFSAPGNVKKCIFYVSGPRYIYNIKFIYRSSMRRFYISTYFEPAVTKGEVLSTST